MDDEYSYSATSNPGHFDTSETVQISGMALLKMLKHAQAGNPSEIVGILLGSFIDDYTVSLVDVFPMPQTIVGNGTILYDDPYVIQMSTLLRKVGRKEEVIGWYKSHPSAGVFLSGVDTNTQTQWEKHNHRFIAVVLDSVQSVKGKVVIGAFRCMIQYQYQAQDEPRETTSFVGMLEKPSTKSIVRGHGRQFYSLPITYRMSLVEQQMLMSLNRPVWTTGFELQPYVDNDKKCTESIMKLSTYAPEYRLSIIEEEGMSEAELLARHVGKIDPQAVLKHNTDDIANREYIQLIRLHQNISTF